MLRFFRNYQRLFFILITIAVVASFVFFGTFDTFSSRTANEAPSPLVVGKTLYQEPISSQKIDALVRFIDTDFRDVGITGQMVNFFNDGFFAQDLADSGLATLLYDNYASLLEEELLKKLAHEKQYVSYRHPQWEEISQVSFWEHFSPQINRDIELLQNSRKVDRSTFEARLRLYLAQKAMPPLAVSQILKKRQARWDWIEPDPSLAHRDLAIFGYHNVREWFGDRFAEVVAHTIVNMATYAKKQGYTVSAEEAKAALLLQCSRSFDAYRSQLISWGIPSAAALYDIQLNALNMSEKEAILLWQEVMCVRKWLTDAKHVAFVESLPIDHYAQYIYQTKAMEVYQMPEAWQLHQLKDLAFFETYLELVAQKPQSMSERLLVQMPLKSVATVLQETPDWVASQYHIKCRQISLEEIANKISLKEILNAQVEKEHWSILLQNYPTLQKLALNSEASPLVLLEQLSPADRQKIDRFSQLLIAKTKKEMIRQELNQKPFKEVSLWINNRYSDSSDRSITISTPRIFNEWLEKSQAVAKQDGSVDSILIADGVHVCELEIAPQEVMKSVWTWEQAKKIGILSEPLERNLLSFYEKAKKKQPYLFQLSTGEFRPFEEVISQVMELYLEPLVVNLVDAFEKKQTHKSSAMPIVKNGAFAAKIRFFPYLDECRERQIHRQPLRLMLEKQVPVSYEKQLVRREIKDPSWNSVFDLKEEEFSPFLFDDKNELVFAQIKPQDNLDIKENSSILLQKLTEAVSKESEHHQFASLMEEIRDKSEIIFKDQASLAFHE